MSRRHQPNQLLGLPPMVSRIAIVVLALLHVSAMAQTRFFAYNTYDQKLPDDPIIDPHSAKYIANLKLDGPMSVAHTQWSTPIFYADETTPIVSVSTSHAMAKALGWNLVPIPEHARPAGHGATGYRDGNMAIVTDHWIWTMYQAKRASATVWSAALVRRHDRQTTGLEQDFLGAPASCNTMLHGLVLYEEIQRGYVPHALQFAMQIPYINLLPGPRRSTWAPYPCVQDLSGIGQAQFPAQNDNYVLGFGQRVQLDPALDLDTLGLSSVGKVIARAMQEYGMIVREGSSETTIYAEDLDYHPDSWGNLLSGALTKIPFDRLRVVESPKPPALPAENVRVIRDTQSWAAPWKGQRSDMYMAGDTGWIASPNSPIVIDGQKYAFVQLYRRNRNGYNSLEWNGTGGRWVLSSDISVATGIAPPTIRLEVTR